MDAPAATAAPLDALTILEHAPDAIIVTDARFRVEWTNPRATEVWGYALADVRGLPLRTFIDPAQLLEAPLRQGELEAGIAVTSTRLVHRRDGAEVQCETIGRRLPDGRYLFVARDATERVALEQAIALSEASFRGLAEASPEAIVVSRHGRFVFCNQAFTSALGYQEAEILGHPTFEVLHPDSVARAAARRQELGDGALEVPWETYTMLRRDGSPVAFEMAGRRIVFQGEPAVVTIGRDLTERRRMESRMAQADRLASIGTLAAGVGHELSNPLTYLQLNLDGVSARLRDATVPAELRDALGGYLTAAHEATRRMQEILAELRQFARPERAAPARADVNRAIDAAVRLTGHQVRLQATVETDLAATRQVPATEGQLTQILVNLVMNAVQAMPEGQAHAHRITLRTWDDGDGVAMAVADTGAGMSPEVLAHVFEPFFTTKAPSAGAGTGLGLSICHSLVTSLGGRMDARSTVGAGTTFTVWLPAVDGPGAVGAAASAPAAPSPPPPAPALARPRVLLIDDEAAIRSVLQQLLVEDYEVEVAESGRAAMALLARDQAFAAIVCDMTMPDVSGAELWGWIEAHHPHLLERMVLMSGGTSAGGTALLQRFPDRWLHKPFSLERLQRVVAERVAARPAAE